ncbi:MAG: DUF1800 domain-containing protein [Rhodobacteraceae bacterium]|nr:DUF1800 domain-containing protein [Paracoccaceae bacterium]
MGHAMHPVTITRRTFHGGLTALGLTALISRGARARPADPADLYLNRLTWGATPEARAAFRRAGLKDWLDEELVRPASDPALSRRLASARLRIEYEAGRTDEGKPWQGLSEARPLGLLDAAPADLVGLVDYSRPIGYPERVRPADEVIAAALIRAVHAPAQLREVMTQFWHDHFSVNALKDETTAALFPPYDRMLREHALGNFRALLGEVARSPPMLRYLDNDVSQASPANENFARELFELHTLGRENYLNDRFERWDEVPGAREGLAAGYIDDDVYEAARAFTGWTIGDGRDIGGGRTTPLTGTFAYVEEWHDPYQKRVLGRELPDHAAPMADGEAVLDLLATHPGTARFVTGKMLRRLGIEAPSEGYRERVARAFLAAADQPDQIARTLRAIVLDAEFAATPPGKLRRPFEFAAALLRTTGAEVVPRDAGAVHWHLRRAGWTQHEVRPPTGHADRTEDWATTRVVAGLVDLALYLHADWMELVRTPLTEAPAATFAGTAAYWEKRFGLAQGALSDVPAAMQADPGDTMPEDAGGREWVNSGFVAAAALTPEFLFR